MKKLSRLSTLLILIILAASGWSCRSEYSRSTKACGELVAAGFREVGDTRDERFLGKVAEYTALCRGGDHAAEFRGVPWVDWANYWGAGDAFQKLEDLINLLDKLWPPHPKHSEAYDRWIADVAELVAGLDPDPDSDPDPDFVEPEAKSRTGDKGIWAQVVQAKQRENALL